MAPSKQDNNATTSPDDDLAQISEAWTKITQGEKTAQALESNLTSLEKKIDDLLASFEESERKRVEEVAGGSGSKKDEAPSNGKESKS